jgi:hypothetical protein
MSVPENDISASGESMDLRAEVADLRRRNMVQLFALVVMSFTLTGFLGLQSRRTSHDLNAMLPQATQVVEANKVEQPRVDSLENKLYNFSKTHPDFATNLLMKYGIRLEPKGGAGPSSSAAPAALDAPPISTPTK